MNSEYMIPVGHPKFASTWDAWAEHIMHELWDHTGKYGANYLPTFDCNAYQPSKSLDKELPKRIYAEVSKMRRTSLTNSWICFDTVYAPGHVLGPLLDNFMNKRKVKDYEVFATSAFAITNHLNDELLDYPIPRLNIICISYTGVKDFCGLTPTSL